MPDLNKNFFLGVLVGVGGVWLLHHFVMPVPGGKGQ